MSLREYAQAKSIGRQRAQQLAQEGRIPATRIDGRWLVYPEALDHMPRRRRPLNTAGAWALAYMAEGVQPEVDPQRRYRLRKYLTEFTQAAPDDAVGLVQAWLASRASVQHVRVPDLDGLLGDAKTVRSGVSDPRSLLRASDVADLYVSDHDWDALRRRHALVAVPSIRATAAIRVVRDEWMPPEQVPLMMSAADLADRAGPRQWEAARDLLVTLQAGLSD